MENTDDIVKYISGVNASIPKDEIFSEIDKNPEAEKIYNKVKVAWAFLASNNKMSEYKIENSYKKFQSRFKIQSKPLQVRFSQVFRYAAIFVLVLFSVPLLFYIVKNQKGDKTELKYTSIIAKNKQISQIILPDSSIVWLNSGTKLTYNNNYSLNNRDLSIEGEAYLNVRRNCKLPLIITCDKLKVKVLGTKFNVNAYPENKNIQVVLESGSVELLNTEIKSFSYKLRPGEMAQYDKALNEVKIKNINLDDYIRWKDGLLIFKDTPMKEVIKILERKYNINIVVKNPLVYQPIFNATFKNENLNEVLDFIQYSCHINYKISENDTDKLNVTLY